MRSILLTGALACGSACAQVTPPVDGWTVYSDLSIWQASDAVPVSQLDDDTWRAYSPRSGRNTALMRNRAAAGVEKNGWQLGVEVRQDAYLVTDRTSVDAYYLYQQGREPLPPATLSLQAHYFSWRAQGLRVGYRFEGPRFGARPASITISAAAYGRQRLRERSVSGTLDYSQEGTFGFLANHVDADSRMIYPFMGDAPRASGAGLSLAASLPLFDAWTLRLQADDLASRLRWKNLPVNSETLGSHVVSYDENGYVNYAPMLSGRKRQVERSVRIPRYTTAALDYQSEVWGAGLQLARYAGETIPTLSLSRRFGWVTLRGNVETRFDSAGIGLEAGNLRLMLQSDALRLERAKARSLQLHYHVVF